MERAVAPRPAWYLCPAAVVLVLSGPAAGLGQAAPARAAPEAPAQPRGEPADPLERVELWLDLGRWDDALAQCDQRPPDAASAASGAGPWRSLKAWALVGKAEGAFGLEDYAAAARWYDAAMEADPKVALLAKDRWAYSRLHLLVDEINGRRHAPPEWARLEERVRAVLAVDPDNAYGRYLLGVVLQNRGQEATARREFLAVAGPRAQAHMSTASIREAAFQAATQTGIPLLARHLDPRWREVQPGPWQRLQTDQFIVYHRNPFVGRKVARAAEYLRTALAIRWYGRPLPGRWDPPCEIYVHESHPHYAQATGRGPATPGSSAVHTQDARVLQRRIDCRQDDPEILRSVLPHELTHLVNIDGLMPAQAPRWLDEGMAVLGEHADKRIRYRRLLRQAVARGETIPLTTLLSLETYPRPDQLDLFYAQSMSLVEFLLARGRPADLTALARTASPAAFRQELAARFAWPDLAAMERHWQVWVLEQK